MTGRATIAGRMDTLGWLLEGDAAIRWQALRDLAHAQPTEYEAERAKVAREGWGARILAEQGADGRWANGYYTPKWTSTFYTLQLLWHLGLEPGQPAAVRSCEVIMRNGFAQDGGLRPGPGPGQPRLGENCESGMGMAFLSWFVPGEPRLTSLRDNLLREQFSDGGWNCQRSATHSSFNTTILVLEGLLEWERQRGGDEAVTAARRRGHEFLFNHRMFRSHTTGHVVKSDFTRLPFPGRWHYDVLRGLDYLAAAGVERDERALEAVELVRSKQRSDGTWPVQRAHAGKTFFEMEPAGQPSRWNTLRALRMLRWWEGGSVAR